MSDFDRKSLYMDYRNNVPFMDLSGFVVKQQTCAEERPAMSLQECLMKKKFSTMINFRRFQYCMRVEAYKNAQR